MAKPRLSKGQQTHALGRAAARAYRETPEHKARIANHVQWLIDHGFPEEVIDRYRTPWQEQTHRVRRGKLVEIPEDFRGMVTHPQVIRKRPSKRIHKLRKIAKHGGPRTPKPAERAALAEEL